MKAITRFVLTAGSITIMAVCGPVGVLAQSHDGHDHEEVAAKHGDHDGHDHDSEAVMSEDDWLKQADDEHGEHEGHDDHAAHADHDEHDEVAEVHSDDDGHDHGNQPVMSEDDWLKQSADDHHDGDVDHEGHNHN